MWLDRLRPGGRLILYLTAAFGEGQVGRGELLKVGREDAGYSAQFLSSVAVFHCIGSRDENANRRLCESIMSGGWESVKSLRRERHERERTCWLHSDDFCLSQLRVPVGPPPGASQRRPPDKAAATKHRPLTPGGSAAS